MVGWFVKVGARFWKISGCVFGNCCRSSKFLVFLLDFRILGVQVVFQIVVVVLVFLRSIFQGVFFFQQKVREFSVVVRWRGIRVGLVFIFRCFFVCLLLRFFFKEGYFFRSSGLRRWIQQCVVRVVRVFLKFRVFVKS